MWKPSRIKKTTLFLFGAMLLYVLSIALGAEIYLPYQIYAPGIFRNYSLNGVEYLILVPIAILCAGILPKKIEFPSDWYVVIFSVFLLAPCLTLGVSSDSLSFSKKIIVLPALVASIVIIGVARNIKTKRQYPNDGGQVGKKLLYGVMFGWLILLLLLLVKYRGVMRFSGVDLMYEQRELTGDVGGVWGYIQLYFVYVFSTLLIAYGLSLNKWRYFILGGAGYFAMYLITAEKSSLMFPLFFLAINYILRRNIKIVNAVTLMLVVFAFIIFGVIYLGEKYQFFDLAGFYLFSRLVATPSQFILDYYEYFSSSGYTFFSQIRGIDLIIDPPPLYASHPKWPQLGWIVGGGLHNIESNSNATFIASDGAASLGALGMILMAAILCFYLIIINNSNQKFPKVFWSTIFAQQAFVLVSGSLFSLLLSFGGLFYLLLFILYKPRTMASKVAR